MTGKFGGLRVVSFESRLSKTLSDLVALHGGVPIVAPSMKEVPIEQNNAALDFGQLLMKGRIDAVVLLTGVGMRALLTVLETCYAREEILAAFKKTLIIPRGPKPVRVLNELGLPYAFTVPEPNTWKELLQELDRHAKEVPLASRTVAVQEYGVTNPELLEGLEKRKAHVLRVPVYRWALPDDTRPLESAIGRMADGEVDVALFTTGIQVDHVFRIAVKLNAEERLRKALGRMVIGSVGPDCSMALRAFGLEPDVEPLSPKMGPLVAETAEKALLILKSKNPPDCAVEVRGAAPGMTPPHDLPVGNGPIASRSLKSGGGVMAAEDLLHESVFMKACRRQSVPYTPVWLMRQAGRYMKEYRDIRDKVPFLDICKNPDLVAEVTVTARERLGTDAAILFADILLIVETFGLKLAYLKGDGPSIKRPVRTAADVDALRESDPEGLSYVYQGVRKSRAALKKNIPLIGFAGAPFTVASYMIQGGSSKDFEETKKFMYADDVRWRTFMQKIVRGTVKYLNGQIDAGVQVVQLFDSWAGTLEPAEYEEYVLPHSSAVIAGVRPGVPVIHFGTGTGPFLEIFAKAGASIVGVDHRIPLDEAWRRIGYDKAIQGNLDPLVLRSSVENVARHAQTVLEQAAGRPGHIFNVGHGVTPETPVDNVIALVRAVHLLSRR